MSEDNSELKAPQEQQPVEYTVLVRVCTLVVWVMVTCRRMESTYS